MYVPLLSNTINVHRLQRTTEPFVSAYKINLTAFALIILPYDKTVTASNRSRTARTVGTTAEAT